MRLNEQVLLELFADKGISCRNLKEYKNLTTPMLFTCGQGHDFSTTVQKIRGSNFKCPRCAGLESRQENINRVIIPEKNGKRLVAIDNATNNIGVAIFDSGKLSYYKAYSFSGDTHERIAKNHNFIINTILAKFKPDFIILEDIQKQDNINTFKVLSMLLGSTVVAIKNGKIPYEISLSSVWRSHFQITGKTRVQKKAAAVRLVEAMYKLKVNDDIAEAILLGKYAVDMLQREKVKKLF